MKKIILITVLIGVALTMSCKRNDVADPQLFGPSTYNIVIAGTASPSSLYIPKERTPQTSLISVKVTQYDGKAVAGKDVIFQQWDATQGVKRGYFDGTLLSVKKTTDSSGSVSANYTVPITDSVYPTTNETIYIVVTLVDDSRQIGLSEIFDKIPLKLYVYEI